MFWNPQDEQIPKLSLEFQFDQDFIEKRRKHPVDFLMISTVLSESYVLVTSLLLNFTCFSMVFLLFLRSWTWIPMFAKFVRDPLLSESLTTLNFPWFEGILAVFINWLVMTRETDQEASDQKLKITFIWALRDFVYKLSLWGREGYKLTKFLTLFHETRENTKLQFIRFSWLNLMIFKFFSIIQI